MKKKILEFIAYIANIVAFISICEVLMGLVDGTRHKISLFLALLVIFGTHLGMVIGLMRHIAGKKDSEKSDSKKEDSEDKMVS